MPADSPHELRNEAADTARLSREISDLREEIMRLNDHRVLRIHNSLWRLTAFQFLRGLAFGLGSVIGATILVYLLVTMLSKIDFIPIIGEWAMQIADMIRENGTSR